MNNKKRCKNEHYFECNRGHNHCRRRPSSFNMHDSELVFNKLNLREGDTFLDLGCGAGDYSIYASKSVGNSGKVYALDIWKETLDELEEEAGKQGLKNIRTMVSDIYKQIDIEDGCIDVCFIATVLHTLDVIQEGKKLFSEIRRVLKPGGKLAIIECKKENVIFGPPINMRISAEELEKIVREYGFEKINYLDLGYNYMIQFAAK